MKKQFLLKQFRYSIPSAALVFAGRDEKHVVAQHLPVMQVHFDFENGKLKLEGDWKFMMDSNKHNETNWFTHQRNRVKIIADIFPVTAINLNDEETNGMILPMEGFINDGESIGGCSGMIVFDNVKSRKGRKTNHWDISFYIYDLQYEYCEIKFRIPLYSNSLTESDN